MKRYIQSSSARLAIAAVVALTVLAALVMVQDSTPALASDSKFYLDCPTTTVQEGESFDVFLVHVTETKEPLNKPGQCGIVEA